MFVYQLVIFLVIFLISWFVSDVYGFCLSLYLYYAIDSNNVGYYFNNNDADSVLTYCSLHWCIIAGYYKPL